MPELTVRYFAAARAAAGVETETLALPGDTATVEDVLRELARRHGPDLEKVVAACSFLLDEVAVRSRETPVAAGAVLDVLPPFAGG